MDGLDLSYCLISLSCKPRYVCPCNTDRPVRNRGVFTSTQYVPFGDRAPAQAVSTRSVFHQQVNVKTDPSLLCPTSFMSGRHPPPTGALLSCFVRSKT
jgi:hypothetical protein